ncbi:hypothetical protein CLNEO_12420 [Anaerotignum neopropionicum]|uniref:Uncharacterized protein n=1 Tax=Anaerotignum neopropionicum TaxID=36847 RepID=A0A136WFH5_9FIRM|nr:hypothetical protein [Anaerotignum neopropionicum]KXL53271.1 hypothetical protein CLNEO_12420 [Anaerotignum neopropionicum]
MLGHFGFSYVGFIYLVMLAVPNILWTKKQPQGYDTSFENKILLFLEKIGQALVTCTALIFQDFNLQTWSNWSWWLIASFFLMILYELWWVRYFCSQRTLADFYSSILGIPVAGATLPVIAFLLLGVYGKVIWLVLSIIILGIGHIGIHLQHYNKIKGTKK